MKRSLSPLAALFNKGLVFAVVFSMILFNANAATPIATTTHNWFSNTLTTAPTLSVISTTGTLSALSTITGTVSVSITFSVSGANMTEGILVTPPSGFEVSTDNTTFTATVTVGAAGTIASMPVYVRLAAADAVNTYSGNIALTSNGAIEVDLATVSSTVIAAPTMSTTGTLSALSTATGIASASTTFSVSGANMTEGILVTPPNGFEVSTDNITFTATITVGAAGTIVSTPVYVRLAAADAVNTYSGNIVLTSSGATDVNVVTVASNVFIIPTITSFSPATGLAGTSVTITGTGFDAIAVNNIVFFGATMATVTAASTTSLTVTVPAGSTYSPITELNGTSKLTACSAKPFIATFTPNKASIATADITAKVDISTVVNLPEMVVIGDLDGDGKPDLVVTNGNNATVSVYRNISTSGSLTTSSFATRVIFTTGSIPYGVAIGDVDGDGKPDLVVTNSSSASISVLRNTSSGSSITFAAKADFATGSTPVSVAIGDLDGDGKPDLAVANSASARVSVFRNTSTSGVINTSSFAAKVDFTTGTTPYSVAIGDLNGDGKPDLAVANSGSASVSVFLNTSAPGSITTSSFANKVDFTTGSTPRTVAIGDLDGDGKPDLVTANNNSVFSVSVLRNVYTSGSFTTSAFATKVDLATLTNMWGMALGDLDGDGKPDIVAVCTSTRVEVFRNIATSGSLTTSSFAPRADLITGSTPHYVAIGDLDGDGKPDLAVNNFGTTTVSVLRNNPIIAPTTQTSNIIFTSTTKNSTTISWTNGNGSSRLVFVSIGTNAFQAPTNNTSYTANANMQFGTQIGTTGWYCVYNSTGGSVNIAGLVGNTTYSVEVVDYNGTGTNSQYAATTNGTNPATVTTASLNTLNVLGLTSSTTAAGAYSLRLLSSSYTGPLVRITIGTNYYDVFPDVSANKKFSLNSPISAAYGTYNATATGATANLLSSVIASSTATVAIWYDQSGNGYIGIQGTTGTQPEIINTGVIDIANNLPTVKFLTATYLVVTATAFDFDLSGSVVYGADNTNTNTSNINGWYQMNGIFSSEQPGGVTDFGYGIIGGKFAAGNGPTDNGVETGTTVIDGVTRINSWTRANTTGDISLYTNGTADGSLTLNAGTRTLVPSVAIGAATSGGGVYFQGTISEIALFPIVYSTLQRQTVEGNQIGYYTGTFVNSITKTGSTPTNAASVQYTVTFATSITGLSISDFSLTTTGAISGASISSLTGSGTTYTVTVNAGSGDGDITLNFANATGLSLPIGTILPFAGDVYTIDKTSPTTTIATMAFSNDGGPSSTDFITSVTAQTISGTTDANLVSGEIVQVSIDNGSTYTTATTSVGSNTWSLSGVTLSSSNTLKIKVTDAAGNNGTVASQAYVLDITTPTDITLSRADINENVAAASTVGTFTTTDAGGGAMTYAPATGTGDTDNASFTISGNTLSINASPDYEVKNSYSLLVRSTDEGGLFFDKQFTISINDLPEVAVNQSSLALGAVGAGYSASITASGGTAPYTTAVTSGSLPTGLTLGSGSISGTPTVSGTFNFTITATDANNFTDAKALSIVVNLGTSGIIYTSSASATYGAADFDPGASSTNTGTTITYTSSDNFVATIVSNKVHLIKVGTVTIFADQAVNANYNAAAQQSQVLTIGTANLTIKADNKTKAYGAAVPALTASYSGFVNGDDATSLATQATLSTTATAATHTSGSPYRITASGAVSSNYMISYTAGTLSVTTVSLTIRADNQSKTYGSANPTLKASYTGFVNGDNATNLTTPPILSTTALASSPVDTYPITASAAVDTDYTISYTQGILAVGQANLTITADNQSKTYGSAIPTLTVSYTGFVNGDTNASLTTQPTLSTAARTNSTVGNYPITASGATSSNYTIGYTSGLLTIGSTSQVITFATLPSKTYGSADFSPGAISNNIGIPITYSSDNSAVATIGSGNIHIAGAGTAHITASQTGDSNNLAATNVIQQLTVAKAQITVIANNQTKVYGSVNPVLMVAYSGFVNGDTPSNLTTQPTASTIAVTGSPVNTYPIIVNGGSGANYILSYTPGTLIVTKAALTITANNQAKAYGIANPTLMASYSGFVNGDDANSLTTAPTLTTTAVTGSPVSTYPITPSGAVSNNYTISYTAGTLTVGNIILTITANNQTKVYGSANPVLAITYGGFVNGDTQTNLIAAPTATTLALVASGAGTYAITAVGAVMPGYTIVYVPGTLTVTKAPLTVTAYNKSRLFGIANPALTINQSGFVNGDTQASLTTTATATTIATATTAPGGYPITPAGAVSANYTISYVNGTLTIIPLSNAAAGNLTISSGKLSPVFAPGTLTYSDSIAYTVDYITLTPTFDPTATAMINGTAVPNGSASYNIPVVAGNNTITTEVTAQDGTTKNTYTVAVYKATAPTAIVPTNIISPNGDGKNDYWIIKDIQLYPKNTVTIYDRVGRAVYTKVGYANDWNGTKNGATLAQGTYYYILYFGPNTIPVKGYITILRSK